MYNANMTKISDLVKSEILEKDLNLRDLALILEKNKQKIVIDKGEGNKINIITINPLEEFTTSDITDGDNNYITYDNGKGGGIGLDFYVKIPGTEESFKKILGTTVKTPAKYDPSTDLYTVVKKSIYSMNTYVPKDSNPSGRIDYVMVPLAPQINGKRFALEDLQYHSFIDIDKINSGQCYLNTWQFKFDQDNEEFIIKCGFSQYAKTGETFQDLILNFVPYNESGKIDESKTFSLKIEGKLLSTYSIDKTYFNNNIPFANNTVYKVIIKYSSVIKEKISEKTLNEDCWYIHCGWFNELYSKGLDLNYLEIYSKLVHNNFVAVEGTLEKLMLDAITITPTVTNEITTSVSSTSGDLTGEVLSKIYPIGGYFKLENLIKNKVNFSITPNVSVDKNVVGLNLKEGTITLKVTPELEPTISGNITINPLEYNQNTSSYFNLDLLTENNINYNLIYKSLYKAKALSKRNITVSGVLESFCNLIGDKYKFSLYLTAFSTSTENSDGNKYVWSNKIKLPENDVDREKHNNRKDLVCSEFCPGNTYNYWVLASGANDKNYLLDPKSDYFDFNGELFVIGSPAEKYCLEGVTDPNGGLYYNTNTYIESGVKDIIENNDYKAGNPIRIWVNGPENVPYLIDTIIIPKPRSQDNTTWFENIYPLLRRDINNKGLNFKKVFSNEEKTLNDVYFKSSEQAYVKINNEVKFTLEFIFNEFSLILDLSFPILFLFVNKSTIEEVTVRNIQPTIDFGNLCNKELVNNKVNLYVSSSLYANKDEYLTEEINVPNTSYKCFDKLGNLLNNTKVYTLSLSVCEDIQIRNNKPTFTNNLIGTGDPQFRLLFSYNYLFNYQLTDVHYNYTAIDYSKVQSVKNGIYSSSHNPTLIP